MNSSRENAPKNQPPAENRTLFLCLLSAAVAIPLVAYRLGSAAPEPLVAETLSTRLDHGVKLFERISGALPVVARPQITNANFCDLNEDGQADMLVCDAVRHTVHWLQQTNTGNWDAISLAPANTIPAPAHTEVVDLDNDGDNDVVVAVLHSVWPTDDREGRVLALINDGEMDFSTHVIADDLCRVTDVQPGDFDADGDIDLAVAEFGHHRGRVLWFENRGDEGFAEHTLSSHAGCIHVPVHDYDDDGDLDIAALISQNDEEVWIYENTGNTEGAELRFTGHLVWGTSNFDLGLAGMKKVDLDQDGDQDFLLAAGDNAELSYPCGQPTHGCIWLENKGSLNFVDHRIGSLAGTYAVDAADLDLDGDLDVVMASMFNAWNEDGATSLAWLENDGNQVFTPWHIDEKPTRLCTVACGDITGDGLPDIVAGSLQLFAPFETASGGLTIWKNIPERAVEKTQ